MRASLAFMFYTIFLSSIICNGLQGCASGLKNETDMMALLAFKDAITLDPNGVLNSWNTSFHYCHWRGISCSTKHPQRVTGLQLISQQLVGRVSAHIGNLSFLRFIVLQNNSFHGEIPPEVGKLFHLRILYLNNNFFSGEVPTNLSRCTNLKQINFTDNKLTGEIPTELSYLPNLEGLGLSKNNLKGKIPPSLGNLSSLVLLSLAETRLHASIPEGLGRLTRLQHLIVPGNKLTGTIPSSIYNLSSLKTLNLRSNSLRGNVASDIGFTLPNLQKLHLGGNLFTGFIPSSLFNASQLQTINFSKNRFSGPIPDELGRLLNLSWLDLGGNMLGTRGGNDLSAISYLTNCTKLEALILGGNKLRGPLPEAIGNLSEQIKFLSLDKNQIYGSIPSGIGNLVNLNCLDVSGTMLHGNIPLEIGKLQNVIELFLYGNQLTGQIPSSLGNLTALYKLDLSGNNLSGNLPPNLGSCKKLLKLNLSRNNLQGSIPRSIFGLRSVIFIDLSHNSLSGSLLPDVGNFKLLETLDISENKLSGGIPDAFGSCLSLEYLNMSHNSFTGTILQTLCSLRGLLKVDLSYNNFSGIIPEYLEGRPLQLLNLSFNNFEGVVPKTGFFENVSVVSLVGNNKLCGGINELNLPSCIVQHSNNGGLYLALKVIALSIVVLICLALLASFFRLYCMRNKSKETPPAALLNDPFIKISYQELLQATDGFSGTNLIGLGSYGSVYKGFLQQIQSFVAVKVFNLQHKGASKSFISECKALRNVRHRNLLKIISVCSIADYQGNDFRALIYELMPRGSLERWLHPQEVADDEHELRSLNIKQRLNIAIDVATAVEYLHCHCQPPIVHGDLKPSNVLIDEDMVACVGDFGLAKVLSKVSESARDDQSSSAFIKGSIGYVPPEYGTGEGASIHGDVYSFGILLLEMFTARRPTDDMFQGDLNLHSFCRMALPERLMDIADPKLVHEENGVTGSVQDCLAAVLRIGLSCSLETPKDRMEIGNAARELHLAKDAYKRTGTNTAQTKPLQFPSL